MKQGTTTTFKVKQFDLPDITEIIFSFTNDKNNVVVERTTPTTDDGQIHKSYPTEVSLEDGYYKIGLDQDETLSLNETFYVEAQIMFSGAVTKAYIDKVKMPHTFYTKVIDGATTNGEEIELTMELSDVIEINGGSTGDYTDLTNKPRINNIELIGNKTTSDLGLDIETGDGLKRVGNVVSVDNGNYLYFDDGKLTISTTALGQSQALRTVLTTVGTNQLASKTYVDNLMSGAVKRLVVESLPTQDIDTNTIYMVLKSVPSTNNIYDEYMYINNAWELIGSTEVDLSNYYTKTESDNKYQLIIDSSHKVNADYIQDGTTNKTVTQTEKNTWNTVTSKADKTTSIRTEIEVSGEFTSAIDVTKYATYKTLNTQYSIDQVKDKRVFQYDSNGTQITSDSIFDTNTNEFVDIDISRASTIKLRDMNPSASAFTIDYGLVNNNITEKNLRPLLADKQDKLTAGTNITIDSNNVISASGGGLSYTFTDGLTESSGTVGIDLASGSKLLIDSNDKLDVDLSSKQDTIDSTHKLDADLVDDTNSTNKFVSASEKQGWNAKADTTDIPTNVSELTNDSGYQTSSDVASAIANKEDKTTITTDTSSTTVSLTLADNNEYRYTQDLTSLTLTMPNGDFISSIVFASGSTPTSMTYDSSIKWSGDDVTSNAFVPVASKTYNIVFWYDGININAISRSA